MYNLKSRHVRGKPYTRTGDILIACNPYKWYNNLYSLDVRHKYAQTLVWDVPDLADPRSTLSPHVYEVSSLAYRGLAVEGDNQSILVSGESGAGKTETVKIMLRDLASVQDVSKENSEKETHSPIVQRVLDSNPLLEAFGNAKTVRNDNSSRFGKYLQLQFDSEDLISAAYLGKSVPSCVLAGSKCEVYLLEKSRVCLHEEAERTYHIFYQLLAAPEETKVDIWDGLVDTDNESFCYVGYTETNIIEGKTDAQRYHDTIAALALVGIEGDILKTLMRVICIVLQLGNILFDADPSDESQSMVSDIDELHSLSELLGVPEETLIASLTIRTIVARNEEFKVPLTATAAKESCDAFAKEIYAKSFLWLVRTINAATSAELNYERATKGGFGTIGMLDIFGFESFKTNRFEQLCINYANEKLQQKFTFDIFQSVKEEYDCEGIELDEITFDDNSDVLDLVEGRMGLLAFLNEECVRPGGNDAGFVSKVEAMNKGNPCFVREKHLQPFVFGVRHYAGLVMYDATAFVTKNMDTLSKDLLALALGCSNEIVASELANNSSVCEGTTRDSAKSSKPKKKAPGRARVTPSQSRPRQGNSSTLVAETVWTKFRNQLSDLMVQLQQTRTRYIRCIKPNAVKQPLLMQHNPTIEQLRCAGVVAAVTISRSAFPNRLDHMSVLDRFKALWDASGHTKATLDASKLPDEERPRLLVERLLLAALMPLQKEKECGQVVPGFVMGKSRAYFRAGALEFLETVRMQKLGNWCVIIQCTVRKYIALSRYRKLRHIATKLQSIIRMLLAKRAFLLVRNSSIALQCSYRRKLAMRLLKRMIREHQATRIQSCWRTKKALVFFKTVLAATTRIQCFVRGSLQRPKYRAALLQKRENAKLENQVLALQRKLEEAEKHRQEAERVAEEKVRLAVEQYREEGGGQKNVVETLTEQEEEAESFKEGSDTQSQSHTDSKDISNLQQSTQQTLMDESGKMLEYLRKEVFKLRSQNTQIQNDFELMKENNQRLMDANASAGASFAALNQHTKQLVRANEKLSYDLNAYKAQIQKLSVTQVELKEELRMKQATYVTEVHSRLQYQKALAHIINLVQDRCRDTRLVEDILRVADACDAETAQSSSGSNSDFHARTGTPSHGTTPSNDLMSGFRSFWS